MGRLPLIKGTGLRRQPAPSRARRDAFCGISNPEFGVVHEQGRFLLCDGGFHEGRQLHVGIEHLRQFWTQFDSHTGWCGANHYPVREGMVSSTQI
jgi:hypothetical protein